MKKGSKAKQPKKKKYVGASFDTDKVLLDVYNAMIRDFQKDFKQEDTCVFSRLAANDIVGIRNIEFPNYRGLPTALFKRYYQLEKFFSRYTAKNDAISMEEREENTVNAFEANNLKVSTLPSYDHPLVNAVFSLARRKAAKILGKLDIDEVLASARFGKRASIGIARRDSYLDVKWVLPMSCSPLLGELAEEALRKDPILLDGLSWHPANRAQKELFKFFDAISLVNVPKKYDKLRPVTPYGTVDSFLSLGIGKVIQGCLEIVGLDLRRLQDVHRKAVKRMSVTRTHVTLDLSNASNSITSQLVNRVIPRDWYRLLRKFQVKKITLPDGRVIATETFAGMGCGFTFPLQTLIYYVLVSAIKELLCCDKGYVSAYGDDLIYPRSIHSAVSWFLDKINFAVNHEKTFVTEHFRESCGEDCHMGVSVRPYSYEGETQRLYGGKGNAFLYKLLNGLLHRWEWNQIPSAVSVLHKYLAIYSGEVLLVPPSYPDYSGFKVSDPDVELEWWIPFSRPTLFCTPKMRKSQHEPVFVFQGLSQVSADRFVKFQFPYYWEKLRSFASSDATLSLWDALRIDGWIDEVDYTSQYHEPEDSVILMWKRVKYRKNGKVAAIKHKPYLARKGSSRYLRTSMSTHLWN